MFKWHKNCAVEVNVLFVSAVYKYKSKLRVRIV